LVRVDVTGRADRALAVAKTEKVEEKYITVIELYVPSTSIANNTNPGE